jgi:diadenosine tetraphosphate (Ap4A) HIT family hydrolase
MTDSCIFCRIVAGEAPARIVWEDEQHVAFLTPWPNTEGFTVLITKEHYPSYAFDLPDDILQILVSAAKTLGKSIDAAFDDVGRTGFIFEGFGVNHIHAKLVPMHGTKMDTWKQLSSAHPVFYEQYPGYIASHNGPAATDADLDTTAEKIRNATGYTS